MQSDPETALFTVAVLILSVIVHEVAHGYAADALGDPTAKHAGRLTLNPLPHLDLFGSILVPGLLVLSGSGMLFGWAKPVPYNPYNLKNRRWGEAIVGVAGVATNLVIAVAFAFLARAVAGTGLESFVMPALIIAWANLFLGLFNLIPFPPLDGFTVLRGLLPYRFAVPLMNLEARLQGPFALVAFLVVFSYIFAAPFAQFVRGVFELLIGA